MFLLFHDNAKLIIEIRIKYASILKVKYLKEIINISFI